MGAQAASYNTETSLETCCCDEYGAFGTREQVWMSHHCETPMSNRTQITSPMTQGRQDKVLGANRDRYETMLELHIASK